jgi:potassium efflux system protein
VVNAQFRRGVGRAAVYSIATFGLLALCVAGSVAAQDPSAGQGSAAGRADPNSVAPESDESRAKRSELEQQLSRLRADAEAWRARASEFVEIRRSAPARLLALESERKALQRVDSVSIAGDATTEELETELLGAEQDLALERNRAAELEAESAQRSERRKRLPELLVLAKQQLQQAAGESTASLGESAALVEVRERLARARRAALEQEIAAHQAELTSFEARGQLLRKRLDLSSRRLGYQQARVEALRDEVNAREQQEALRAAESARESLAQAAALPSAVQAFARELAEQNAELAGQRAGEEGLPGKIDDLRRKLGRADERVVQVEQDFGRLVRKIEAAGLSDSMGLLLRKQRSEMPDIGKYRRFIRMRQELISSVQVEQIEWRERRRELANIDRVVERAMSRLDASVSADDREVIEALLRDLLETKRDYIDSLIGDYELYFQMLVDFDARQQELIEKTEALLLFIDERVLWIPSGLAVRPSLLEDGADALGWLFAPRFIGQLLRAFGKLARGAVLLNVIVALAFVALMLLGPRVRARLASLAEEARKPTSTRAAPTAEAFALCLLLAVGLPGLLGYLGWQLSVSPGATQYVRCVAFGALSAALIWISIGLPRQLLCPNGVADAHFGMPQAALQSLRRGLTGLLTISVPAVFVIQTFELRGEDVWRESVGRVAFLLVMGCVALFTHAVMRERAGALWQIAEQSPSLLVRRWVWRLGHGGLVAAAVLLGVATLRGYYWTSLKLAASLHFTLVFVFLLLAVFRLCLRWSLVARRRLAFEQLEKARTAQRAEPADGAAPELEPELDLIEVDAQTSRLLKSAALVGFVLGLWAIWSDLLPAVGILREVELWSTMQSVTVELVDATGARRFAVEERILPITLADLLFALLIAAMALVTVRNLPGFLEITVFRRLTGGERYAYATIAKYSLTLIGLALAFSAVGIGWSNIQWLVAAVGLGLGFGLQEIFANFVSGLIILFERPIRVGDTVTVGDVSGVVQRIRIRATWITCFDRKELVVPNKEFVTTRLINWSHSDSIVRVEVPVGIAYGSDTERAIEVLRRIAGENEHVLEEPAPDVFFLGFGASSLDFELRAFSPDVEHRLPILHALNMEIDRAFRAEGIEIAFPQRDVHLRSVPPSGAGSPPSV